MSEFTPRLETLPPAQRRLWDELGETPSNFVLYGGTAIALHLGHRLSLDFDFFGGEGFDPGALYRSLKFLARAVVLQQAEGTLSCAVERGEEVKVSFFSTPFLGRIEEPAVAPNGVRVASLLDLAATKADVVQKRAEAKDYLDLDAIIQSGVALERIVAAARSVFGDTFNPQITLKALSYFADGTLPTLPHAAVQRLVQAVALVDLDRLPDLSAVAPARPPKKPQA